MSGFSQDQFNAPYAYAQLDDPLVWENQQDFSGGEDSYRRATLIDPNQCQHLLNVWVRDNYEARTRPGADALPTAGTLPIAGATAIRSLKFFYTPTVQQLLACVDAGGTPKFVGYQGGAWSDFTNLWHTTSSNNRPAMEQGIDKMLIADGVSPVIWDGTTITTTGGGTVGNDVPQGATILCWHTARMFASGVSTDPDTIWVSNLLAFTDGNWNSTTRSFRIGVGDGDPVVAMASMQTTVLCVLKQNSVWLINTDPSQDSVSAPTTINGFTAAAVPGNLCYGIGCVGRDAWCSYANDVLFMAQDGVRSVQRMQAATGQYQLSAPLSQPIQSYIERINRNAWGGIVAKSYLEFVFFFVPLDNSATNNFVLVYNARLQKWMGAWTNWTGLCCDVARFSGSPRFVFGDASGRVNQWKDLANGTDDGTYLDNGAAYPTQVWTRSYQFQELITNKTGYDLIVRFTDGNAQVSFTWMGDLAILKQWVGSFAPDGDILGVDVLPFLLQADAPTKLPYGIRGLPDFNEAFLKMETQRGWFWLRSVSASSFINPLAEMH